MGGRAAQDPDIQAALNPIKLCVQLVGRRGSFRFPHLRTKIYFVWNASKNKDILSPFHLRAVLY
jgi:hypothetical protein